MFILIAGRTFNWLHDGKNVNGELILRENGTCKGCGAEGKWHLIDESTTI